MIQSPTFWGVLFSSAAVFWLLPARLRYTFLALTSFAYLATIEPVVVTTFSVIALAVFLATRIVARSHGTMRWLTPLLVVGLLGYLALNKYNAQLAAVLPFLSGNLAVPLGISYFSFKLTHYVVEVNRGTIRDRSLSMFLAYVLHFPIFTAGPIERFDNFLANRDERWQLDTTVHGTTRIAHGLIKKFVILQLVFPPVRELLVGPGISDMTTLMDVLDRISVVRVWAFLFCEFVYTYLDFSAYSDIAIGASRLYGIKILENFNWPILARNISDFWKRWHMTLAGWCQRYVYLPTMGLTREPRIAVFATFTVMGLWHGGGGISWVNWVLWGFYHASGVALYQSWARLKRMRGWQSASHGWRTYVFGVPATVAFVSGSYAFSSTAVLGWRSGIALFAKCFGVVLP